MHSGTALVAVVIAMAAGLATVGARGETPVERGKYLAAVMDCTGCHTTGALAGQNGAVFFQSVPTLDEVGLGVLIALVAGVAGWAVRRGSRK